jgi:hypothetical protein
MLNPFNFAFELVVEAIHPNHDMLVVQLFQT